MRNDNNSLQVILDIMTAWATIYRDNFFRHSHWDAHHARAFWHERDRCARIVPPTVAKSREKHCREDARRFRIHVDRGVTRNYRPVHVSHPESCRLSRVEHFSLVFTAHAFFRVYRHEDWWMNPSLFRTWSCGTADITERYR